MMLRYLTGGESHGQALTAIVEGLPAGLNLDLGELDEIMRRRQGGYGRGGRMEIETDKVQVISGLRGGMTLGSPLTLLVYNRDWENWQEIMDPVCPARSDERKVTTPRPGHADLAGGQKYRQTDLRNILERASARETAARVAVGAVARQFLRSFGIKAEGQVVAVGEVRVDPPERIVGAELYQNMFYCPAAEVTPQMAALVDQARREGDSLGGVVRVIVEGLPPGLGSHVHWDRRLDGRLAQAVMSIPAVKGVEIGAGFDAAGVPGSQVHDEIFYTPERGFYRLSNKAGGLEGGITNGQTLVVKAAMKPIPTLTRALRSVDIVSKDALPAAAERSDVCAVPAAAVVAEAAVAWVIAGAVMEKFGGDHMDETLDNYSRYLTHLGRHQNG